MRGVNDKDEMEGRESQRGAGGLMAKMSKRQTHRGETDSAERTVEEKGETGQEAMG